MSHTDASFNTNNLGNNYQSISTAPKASSKASDDIGSGHCGMHLAHLTVSEPSNSSYPPDASNAIGSAEGLCRWEYYNARPATTEHLGKHRNYWRDIILGVNDGIISTFLLVAGVTGGGMLVEDVLLTAVAGSIAGAVSMCAGEIQLFPLNLCVLFSLGL